MISALPCEQCKTQVGVILRSRYVVTVDGPVIENGAVRVRDGVIEEVDEARRISGDAAEDFGDAVILPGFINAHTHLELGFLADRVPPQGDLLDWLRRVRETVISEGDLRTKISAAVAEGIRMSVSAGVTTIGDISKFPGSSRPVLADSGLHAVCFGEVIAIGNQRSLLDSRLDEASSREWETSRMRVGISPHAPYSVEPDALRACAVRADEMEAPLCIHLCESEHEDDFTRSGAGPFADHLRRLEIWDDDIPVAGVGAVELALITGVLGKRTVIAHGNYIHDSDLQRLAASGASVAYCPRTHGAFGHRPHPFEKMLRAGVNVCIGTDSLASTPDLSVLGELRFLQGRLPDLSPEELIAMGTIRGAEALGLAERVGSITPGKSADLVVIPLEQPSAACRWESVLESRRNPAKVIVGGRRSP